MEHILTENQRENFIRQCGVSYRNYKVINTGNWTNESSYKMGIVDFCDALVSVSREITNEVSSLRVEIECLFEEIDNE